MVRGNGNGIEYMGIVEMPYYDISTTTFATPKSHTRGITPNPFTFGDMMEYVGYATINGTEYESQHTTQAQNASETLVLMFDVAQVNIDGQPCSGTPTVTDQEGNVYNTVQIGNQCWMRENLRTTKYADNTDIAQGSTTSYTTAYWYYPNNDASNKLTYGLLYNWPAVMYGAASSETNPSGVQGICPNGWHVPSYTEWTQLTNYVSSQSEYVCDGCSDCIAAALAPTIGWTNNYYYSGGFYPCNVGDNPSANNATGFSTFPAGAYYSGYDSFGNNAYFWSATDTNSSSACSCVLGYNRPYVYFGNYDKYGSFSVRCIRD